MSLRPDQIKQRAREAAEHAVLLLADTPLDWDNDPDYFTTTDDRSAMRAELRDIAEQVARCCKGAPDA